MSDLNLNGSSPLLDNRDARRIPAQAWRAKGEEGEEEEVGKEEEERKRWSRKRRRRRRKQKRKGRERKRVRRRGRKKRRGWREGTRIPNGIITNKRQPKTQNE